MLVLCNSEYDELLGVIGLLRIKYLTLLLIFEGFSLVDLKGFERGPYRCKNSLSQPRHDILISTIYA